MGCRTRESCGLLEEFWRIARRHKIEALRRRRRTGLMIVFPGEQSGYIQQRPTLETNIHHRADQQPDHVVEKPISLNVEAYSPSLRTKLPLGERKPTAVMWLVRLRGKRPEIVLALELTSGSVEQSQIQRPPERPFKRPTEG
jgi:hypothetical protein